MPNLGPYDERRGWLVFEIADASDLPYLPNCGSTSYVPPAFWYLVMGRKLLPQQSVRCHEDDKQALCLNRILHQFPNSISNLTRLWASLEAVRDVFKCLSWTAFAPSFGFLLSNQGNRQ